ncbi:HAD family hydrolase [Tetragenococcus koreensis]|uniref:Beta-phosphoglucomutase n=2 Tax=Tetragenococcus koreensis TaxID=290335 RepID=A0AAN4UDG7_9ENTE|nr:HAD family hydrolase [Tetragenococcus koreensis]MDN6751006.1 HAD family hydrolase [Staphylococcus equorum]AYW46678.1 haloacid dehalogenase [Tetragenococcus koreensis]MCF1585868.1 HAD family hydrolase [Tetragenococcus koreensis]MCF1615438.1 HAD family hydrolase [Tetragenococcus koreensis]MCF1617325.1 HAD family hydrolase [Tetragenococcus koreensis]
MNTFIFDMDGVIVDSEYTYFKSKTDILHEAGHDVPVSYQYQFMGTTSDFMWQIMKEEFNLPQTVEEYGKEMNRRRDEIIQKDGVQPIANVRDLIKRLSEAGFKLGVASASRKEEIIRNLKELGLDSYFTQAVSAEEVEHSKPEPDVFLHTAELLGSKPSDCIVIEDTKNGTRAAKAAEMYCVGFANPDYPAQDLSCADEIIKDFREINENWLNEKRL